MKMPAVGFLLLALLLAGTPGAVAQSGADPAGDWRGILNAGAVQLRIALHLGSESTFDSPDQGVSGSPAQFGVVEGRVTVTLRGAGQFEGRLSADGTVLEGTYRQGGASFPLRFERGTFAPVNRPQTPKPPFPYNVEEVEYGNAAQPGLRLAGTLTTPRGAGPFPAVLLITGSGAQDRDETLYHHKPFAVLADALTRRGIAVLRVDDRGVGRSGAGPPDATTTDFAGDAAAGLVWLRQRRDIDAARIGLLGHSEGAIVAALVASGDPRVAFVVLWAGSGVDGKEIIVDQVRGLAMAQGLPEIVARANANVQRELLDALLGTADGAAAKSAMNAVLAKYRAPPVDDATVALMDSKWYRGFLKLDPAPALRAIQVPVLALLGGKDTQVSAQLNEAPLRAVLAGNARATVEVLPGLNHLFQAASTGAPAEYGQIEQTIDPAALDRMVGWIAGTTEAAALESLLDQARSLPALKTVVIARDGRIVAERGYRGHSTTAPANIKSASKLVMSALVGIAVDRGVLESTDQPIAGLLAQDLPSPPDPRLQRVTIGHLLSMQAGLGSTSGARYGAWVTSRNWVRAALARPFEEEPGGRMIYSTGSTHLLSAILTRRTGRSTLQLARDWLGPLEGFAISSWTRDPQGIYMGGNEMAMSPRSLLAFGELYRAGGVTPKGERLLSQAWIDASWQPRTRSPWTGDEHGYAWFLTRIAGEEVRYGWGHGGQMLYIVPGLALTVVMTSDEDASAARSRHRDELHRLLRAIIGAFVPAR